MDLQPYVDAGLNVERLCGRASAQTASGSVTLRRTEGDETLLV